MKKYLSVVIIILAFFSSPIKSNPASIVYDITNGVTMMNQLTQTIAQLEQMKQMVESIGKGDFNPSVLNFLDNTLRRCGFSKLEFPLIPIPKIPQICGNEQGSFNTVLDFYNSKVIPLPKDSIDVLKEKEKERERQKRANSAHGASISDINTQKHAGKKEKVAKIQEEIKNAKNQNESLKIMNAILVEILAEEQEQTLIQSFMLKGQSLGN